MHEVKLNLYIDRENLMIYYSDPITLVTVKCIQFKTLEELEKYIYEKRK